MEKPYSFKDLALKLKANGLEAGEETAKAVTKSVFAWLGESAILSPNVYDDVMTVLLPILEKPILEMEDKINPAG